MIFSSYMYIKHSGKEQQDARPTKRRSPPYSLGTNTKKCNSKRKFHIIIQTFSWNSKNDSSSVFVCKNSKILQEKPLFVKPTAIIMELHNKFRNWYNVERILVGMELVNRVSDFQNSIRLEPFPKERKEQVKLACCKRSLLGFIPVKTDFRRLPLQEEDHSRNNHQLVPDFLRPCSGIFPERFRRLSVYVVSRKICSIQTELPRCGTLSCWIPRTVFFVNLPSIPSETCVMYSSVIPGTDVFRDWPFI